MVDPFSSLGLPPRFDLDRRELERRYRDLQRELHPDRHVTSAASTRRMSLLKAMEVNEAYRVLKDDAARAEALLALVVGDGHKAEADPMFLMEIMELREALSDAKVARDAGQVEALAKQVRAEHDATLAAMTENFGQAQNAGSEGPSPALRAALLSGVGKLKYYKRFLSEVQAIEDFLLG